MTQMDTPHTIRASELRDLYSSITLSYLSQEERLDVLLTLKHTVKVSNNLYSFFFFLFFSFTLIITFVRSAIQNITNKY